MKYAGPGSVPSAKRERTPESILPATGRVWEGCRPPTRIPFRFATPPKGMPLKAAWEEMLRRKNWREAAWVVGRRRRVSRVVRNVVGFVISCVVDLFDCCLSCSSYFTEWVIKDSRLYI